LAIIPSFGFWQEILRCHRRLIELEWHFIGVRHSHRLVLMIVPQVLFQDPFVLRSQSMDAFSAIISSISQSLNYFHIFKLDVAPVE
jgi:hypothetical protein